MEEYLSMADASRWSGLAIQTLRNLLKAGELRGEQYQTNTGPRWHIDTSSLAELVRSKYGRGLPDEVPPPEPRAESQRDPERVPPEAPASADHYATLRALTAGLVAEVERLTREG